LALVAGSEEAAMDFSIKRQPLSQALLQVSRQANVAVVVSPELVEEKMAPEVHGTLSLAETLHRVLHGSGLGYIKSSDGQYAIVKLGEPRPIADTSLRPLRFAATEQNQPSYTRLAQSDTSAGEDSDGQVLNEVVVTARKRLENVQEVPSSISVLTGDEISRRGLNDMDDYLRSVPGVNFVKRGNNDSAIVIRGIETSPADQNFSAGTTVATYFGETAITNAAGLGNGSGIDMKLVDIARVEVLRGPQGTAFGDSSLGGAVRTIPNVPQLNEWSGSAGADISSTSGNGKESYSVQGALNIPLINDRLAMRLVGYQFEDTGYVKYDDPSKPAYQAALALVGGSFADPSSSTAGDNTVYGYRLAGLLKLTDNASLNLTYAHQDSEQDGSTVVSSFGKFGQVPQYKPLDFLTARGKEQGVVDYDIDIVNLTADVGLGWATLTGSVSYVQTNFLKAESTSAADGQTDYARYTPNDHETKSGEIRLASSLDGPFQFLAGIFAEDRDDSVVFDYWWAGDPNLNFLADIHWGTYDDRRKWKQKALFGELSYEIIPNLKATVGGRHYDYDRDVQVITSGPAFVGAGNPPDVSFLKTHKTGETFKASLDYKLIDNWLVYASWAEGFRLGRPAAGLPVGVCDTDNDGIVDEDPNISIASTRNIDSDDLESYELGVKASLLGGRMQASADVFRINWAGLPIRAGATCQGANYSYVGNVGEASSQGVEVQLSMSVARSLHVDMGASYIEPELEKDAPLLLAVKGDPLPGSPNVNANLGVQYDFPFMTHRAFVRADSMYTGEFFGNLQESPASEAGGYVRVNAQVGATFGSTEVRLYVENLTNEDAYTWRGLSAANPTPEFGYRLRPRTVGVRFGYHF
jgi:outer membrane receptor protein involved in Fe transport